MTRSSELFAGRALALLAIAAIASPALSQDPNDIEWGGTSPAGDDYNVGANWPEFGFVPEAGSGFNEQALINNGGLAFLSATPGAVGGVFLGGDGLSTGALEIRSGGNLTVVDNGVTTGDVNVGVQNGPAGFLTVERGGTLTTEVLRSGAGDSSVVLGTGAGAGVATVVVNQATLFRSDTRLTPNASLTTSQLQLGGQSNLITEISGGSQPTISVGGFANLNGVLTLEIDGAAPGLGASWTLLEAGAIGSGFASIDRTALAPGLRYTQEVIPSGAREQLQVAVEADLTLMVTRSTGEATLVSESGAPVAISAYNVRSDEGLINTGYNTLENQSLGGFAVSGPGGITANQSGELSSSGGLSINGAGVSFGSLYNAPATPAFGTPVADSLQLDYVRADGVVFTADIEFDTEPLLNNLLLTIDPATGDARLSNESITDIAIDVYSVGSESGSLETSWNGLSDQGFSAWQEGNPNANRVSELNPTEALALPAGASVNLPGLWDSTSTAEVSDLSLEFRETVLGELDGVVVFDTLTAGISGDYNDDGAVNAADYTVWRDASPTDVLPNDLTPGTVDASDYDVWSGNYGKSLLTAPGAAQAVPEPGSLLSVLFGSLACLVGRRRTRPLPLASTRENTNRSASMTKSFATLAAVAVVATTASAQPVTITAVDVQNLPGAFTDGSITITAFDENDAITGFGSGATFFGPGSGSNVNAINDTDGDPTTTTDRDSMSIEFASGVSLTEINFAFTRANPILFSGFGADPLASFASNPGGGNTLAYDDTTGTLAVFHPFFGGQETVIRFNNGAATDGQTLLAEVADYHQAGPQLAFSGITYDPNFTALVDGDVDGLNGVTIDDFNIIRDNFWSEGARADGDLTGDGFVSLVDFAEWEANFAGNSSGLAAQLVPEPSAAILALLGIAAVARTRR